jgi:hypothetical protein
LQANIAVTSKRDGLLLWMGENPRSPTLQEQAAKLDGATKASASQA